MYAVYECDGKEVFGRIICLGLTVEGEILLLDVGADGIVGDVLTVSNFKEIRWGECPAETA